jgi:hypothetical protein
MTKKNTTRANRRNHSSETISATKSIALPKFLKNASSYEYVLTGLTLAYFIYYVFKLYSSLGDTFFWADENFHAYITSVIFEIKSLPAELPENIHGGYEYSYPPFFHILSAIVMSIAGFSALKFTNLILLVLFLAGFYILIRKHYGNNEALLACLLISMSPILAINTIRFMTEMLSMVLVFFSFFYLVVAIKKGKNGYAIISGLATGLLILSKQVGIVVLGYYSVLLVWFIFMRRSDVRLMLYVIGTAVLVVTPYLIWTIYHRIEIFGFLSLFLGAKVQWAAAAVKSFRNYDSSLKEFGFLFYKGNHPIIIASLLIPFYQFIRTRARDVPQNYIFLMAVYLAAVMVVWHITNDRHIIILLPLIAFLFGYGLPQVIKNRLAISALILIMLIMASIQTHRMPNLRQHFNAPKEFLDLTATIKNDAASNGKTLGIWAFDTVMYTRKPVIWPYPDLRAIPTDLFAKQSPVELYDLFKQYGIDFVLLDMRFTPKTENYTGRNYPLPFINNCDRLLESGKISLVKLSQSKDFVLLKVI